MTSTGTMVYLNIEFTKEGAKKLEDISNTYVEQEETTQENTTENETATGETTEEQTEEKTITMKIDGGDVMTTSFDEPLRTGKLQLSIGSASTDADTLNDNINQANNMAIVLDTGNMPIKYEVDTNSNKYIKSDITQNELQMAQYIILAITAIALIILIIRYKTLGILGTISYIGLVSIFLLVIRYANVVLSLEGIFGIAIVLILNYIFVNKFLNKLKENSKELEKAEVIKANKETYKEFFIKIIPIIIMVVAFCFIQWMPISSFGMVMIWGIALIAIYNVIITNNLLRLKAKN